MSGRRGICTVHLAFIVDFYSDSSPSFDPRRVSPWLPNLLSANRAVQVSARLPPWNISNTIRAISTTKCSTRTASPGQLPRLYLRMPVVGRGTARRQQAADRSMLKLGITFNVYGDGRAPNGSSRSTSCRGSSAADEWEWIERGLQAADHRAEPVHRRHLPRAANRQGRRDARARRCHGQRRSADSASA